MLMTALLSLIHLQQPQMAMSQHLSELSALEQPVATEAMAAVANGADVLSVSPSTQACGAANNSRKSCGGTGRRELM